METIMRTTKDRIRHTILFEIFLVSILVPLLSTLLGKPMHTMGALSLSMSGIAMGLNYFYNYVFDHTLKKLGRPVYERGAGLRIAHAILFEILLFAFSAPLIMYLMDYSFIQAVMLDLGFMIMVPIYAFIFNIIYDRVFPVPMAPCEAPAN